MNPRRIVRTLIVVLVTIVGRWLIRVPLTPMPDDSPVSPLPRPEPPPPSPSPTSIHEPARVLERNESPESRPSLSLPDTLHATATSVDGGEAPVAGGETPVAGGEAPVAGGEAPVVMLATPDAALLVEQSQPALEPFEASLAGRPSLVPSPGMALASETNVAVRKSPLAVRETPVAVLERPVAVSGPPDAVRETLVAAPEPSADILETSVCTPETPVAAPATHASPTEGVGASDPLVTTASGPRTSDRQAPQRERDDAGGVTSVGSAPSAPAVEAAEPMATPTSSHANVDPPFVRESRRSRRRSESTERSSRLLGGAGFVLAAITCFIASFVLFVRLTTPDRSPPVVYAVVPYVAASERNVPPALASFVGDFDSNDMWLVVRLPVAARYVALTGLRTVDRWTTNRFALSGTKPTLASNAASCYSGAGVADGPPVLTPLSEGLVVRDAASASLAPERLVRVDVGALLADTTSTKTLVCAIAPPARTGFASYAATIGVPNVPASEATGSRVRLSALPLGVDYSTFGNASAMRFTQTSLAVATDPLHATLDVAGFETFAYDDPEGDARRDVLLFIAGALATIGAVAVADALRPWLGIERR